MFGKHFASMYSGSLFGKSTAVFAVWGYAISHMRPISRGGPCHVEINPTLLAATFSTTAEEIDAALLDLEAPDPASRSGAEGGRRLILLGDRRSTGPMQYRVVNGDKYRALRDEEERRLYLTEKKREERATKRVSTKTATVNHGQPRSTQAEAEVEEEKW